MLNIHVFSYTVRKKFPIVCHIYFNIIIHTSSTIRLYTYSCDFYFLYPFNIEKYVKTSKLIFKYLNISFTRF